MKLGSSNDLGSLDRIKGLEFCPLLSCLGVAHSFIPRSIVAKLHSPKDGEIHGLGGVQQASAPVEIPQKL